MTSPTSSGTIRLGGLTSGFDTEAIVQQLLAVDQARIDGLESDKELASAKIDTWEDVAEQLRSFADAVSVLRADGTEGNTLYDDKSVSSNDSTVATATASSSAASADYTVTVTNLAQAHVIYGDQKASNYTLPGSGTVTINGASVSLTAGMTLSQVAAQISGASYATGKGVTATVIDERLVLQTDDMGASATIHGAASGTPPFVNATDDANDILDGELGLIDAGGNIVNQAQASQDASFTVNGISVTRTSNTVTDVIEGVTLTILKGGGSSTNLSVDVNTEEIKEAITNFVDVFNETRDFIDRVRNATVDEEDEFGLFFSDPLMRELFNKMRELTTTGVKMGSTSWDGTVLSNGAASIGATSITLDGFSNATGTLSAGDEFIITGDSTIYKVQNDASIAGNAATVQIDPPLVVALSDNTGINLNFRTLEDFGVGTRTDTVSGTEGIIGILDEGTLDSMLASSIDTIKRIFTRSGDEEQRTGVARRLYDWLDNQTRVSVLISKTRAIDDTTIDNLESKIDDLDEQIERLQDRLAQQEQALIRRFADMENAMAEAQSAGSAIQGLSGGSGQ